jgi:hypothetical protein
MIEIEDGCRLGEIPALLVEMCCIQNTYQVHVQSCQTVSIICSQEASIQERLLAAKLKLGQKILFGGPQRCAVFRKQTCDRHAVDAKHEGFKIWLHLFQIAGCLNDTSLQGAVVCDF